MQHAGLNIFPISANGESVKMLSQLVGTIDMHAPPHPRQKRNTTFLFTLSERNSRPPTFQGVTESVVDKQTRRTNVRLRDVQPTT